MLRASRAAVLRRRVTFLAAVLVGALAFASPVSAHQPKSALSTLELNERTGLVEIVHRFWVHDAEHAAEEVTGVAGDLRSDDAAQAAFARYVREHFALADAERTPLALEDVGVEVDGPYVWVYQELPGEALDRIAWLRFDALQELWRDQVNQLNATMRTIRTRTAIAGGVPTAR